MDDAGKIVALDFEAPVAAVVESQLPPDATHKTDRWTNLLPDPPRHAGRMNVAFYDGHVEPFTAEEIDPYECENQVLRWLPTIDTRSVPAGCLEGDSGDPPDPSRSTRPTRSTGPTHRHRRRWHPRWPQPLHGRGDEQLRRQLPGRRKPGSGRSRWRWPGGPLRRRLRRRRHPRRRGRLGHDPNDNPCTGGQTSNCDDNCADPYNPDQADSNPDQADANGNSVGAACDPDESPSGPTECESEYEGYLIDNGMASPWNGGHENNNGGGADAFSTWPLSGSGFEWIQNSGHPLGDASDCFRSTMQRADVGSSGKVAYTFMNLVPGEYRIYVTWPEDPQGATNATYRVYNGLLAQGNEIGSDSVDQSQPPPNDALPVTTWQCCPNDPHNDPPDECPYDGNYDDFVSCGRWDAEAGAVDNSIQHEYRWYEIAGGPFNIDATVLTLVLDANGADGRVTADAVWLERGSCSEPPPYEPMASTPPTGPDPCDLPPINPAVKDGLDWIVEHQQADGSWHFAHSTAPGTNGPPCANQCSGDGGGSDHAAVSTGFGILALLSAGYTPVSGPEYYRNALCKAINWMMDYQNGAGGYHAENSYEGHGLLEHLFAQGPMAEALTTSDWAMQEGCGYPEDDCHVDMHRLRSSVQMATNYTITEREPFSGAPHRDPELQICSCGYGYGGWHYRHHQDFGQAGVTETPWGVLCLKTSEQAGIDFPVEELEIADHGLRNLQCDNVFGNGEWIGRKYYYLSYGTTNDNKNSGCLMSRALLDGNRADHPAMVTWLDYMFASTEVWPYGDDLTTGTQTQNNYEQTKKLDDINHVHADSGGNLELSYQFNTPEGVVPTSVDITGYLNSADDAVEVSAYNWTTGNWEQIGTLEGSDDAGEENQAVENFSYELSEDHLNENVELAENVAIRFYGSGLSGATLAIDEIKVNYPRHISFPEDYWIAFFSHRLIQYTPSRTAELSGPLRDYLLALQRRDGHAKGSWDPAGTLGGNCGRIFSTSMAVMILNELDHGLRLQP